jgi:hypothetical protein
MERRCFRLDYSLALLCILLIYGVNSSPTYNCFGYLSTDTQNVCSGRGICSGDNKCSPCFGGYGGIKCQYQRCYPTNPTQPNTGPLIGFGEQYGATTGTNFIDTNVSLTASGQFHTLFIKNGAAYAIGCAVTGSDVCTIFSFLVWTMPGERGTNDTL